MKLHKLKDMFKGWIVGNFEPSLYKTDDVEVAVKNYKAGERDENHYHKIATEITIIFATVPSPGRCLSGIQRANTVKEIKKVAAPILSGVFSDIP